MQVQLEKIIISPGQQLLIADVSWEMYEQLLAEYGEKRGARIHGTNLEINLLQVGQYLQVRESSHFPGLPLLEVIPQYLKQSKIEGRNKTMKAFRTWIKAQIK
jgi:hypothetical protein